MTIFRSRSVDASKLTYQYVSSNAPDNIGVEAVLDGDILFALSVGEDGGVLYDVHMADVEFDLSELLAVLAKCETELNDWRNNLIKPGGIWSKE
jgi:hypothetical protein